MTDIHTQMPNRIAEPNCQIVKLNSFCQIDLTNRIAMQNELPNRIAKSKYLIELPNRQIEFVLPNRIAKSNCRIIKLNSFCRIEMPNRIAKSICQIEISNRIADLSN
jgi:hypothetical protein